MLDDLITMVLSVICTIGLGSIIYVLSTYVFRPSFLYIGVTTEDRIRELEALDCTYLNHRFLNTPEELNASPYKMDLCKQYGPNLENFQFVEALDNESGNRRFFWFLASGRFPLFPFNSTRITINEEVSLEIIKYFRKKHHTRTILIESSCPACGNDIVNRQTATKCSDCGLSFVN